MKTKLNKAVVGWVNRFLVFFGYTLAKLTEVQNLRVLERSDSGQLLSFLRKFGTNQVGDLLEVSPNSKSQLRQDLFVLAVLQFKREGYFVEFGATNGIDLSNTWLLEKHFEWTGILGEPARIWHDQLLKNRSLSVIDSSCVWIESNLKILFNETESPELSTIDEYSKQDGHSHERALGKKYTVSTITLIDLLQTQGAPSYIDYLSIDTEGSEFAILSAFDFSKYSFGVITCEHNYSPQRDLIYNLLVGHGYKRVFASISNFDDWYIGPGVSISHFRTDLT